MQSYKCKLNQNGSRKNKKEKTSNSITTNATNATTTSILLHYI